MKMRRMNFSTTSRLGCLVVFGLLVLVAGCGRKASISGKVLYNGEPMPGGQVTFVPVGGGPPGTAGIDPKDGSYEIPSLSTGKMKIGVTSVQQPRMPSGIKFGPPKDSGAPPEATKAFNPGSKGDKYVPISKHYNDPDTSNLEFEVKAGKNTHDIELSGPKMKIR
jgi:hypothetical protein